MAIFIDPPAWPGHGTHWSHLVSDVDTDELHPFARQLGIPRRGFDLDHYDVPASLYDRAVAGGARPVSAREVVHRLRGAGLRVRQADREAVTPLRRRDYLRSEWQGLAGSFGIEAGGQPGERWLAAGDGLIARWNEPHRRYHDEIHLEDVLLSLDHLSVLGERVEPVTLAAAWFHDAVYAGVSGADAGADELASARLATETLGALGLDPALAMLIGDLIIETTPGREILDPEPHLAQLLDADLAIFAAAPWRYDRYASAVRDEYVHVAMPDFAAARAGILRGYLAQPAIYRTDAAVQLWEERARVNLEREVEALESLASS